MYVCAISIQLVDNERALVGIEELEGRSITFLIWKSNDEKIADDGKCDSNYTFDDEYPE